jgi:hypothetical protein
MTEKPFPKGNPLEHIIRNIVLETLSDQFEQAAARATAEITKYEVCECGKTYHRLEARYCAHCGSKLSDINKKDESTPEQIIHRAKEYSERLQAAVIAVDSYEVKLPVRDLPNEIKKLLSISGISYKEAVSILEELIIDLKFLAGQQLVK